MRTNDPLPASNPSAAQPTEGLHDIVGPLLIRSVYDWILLVLILMAVAGIAAALVWWWRRRRWLLAQPVPPPPPLPPHTRAWRELEAALRLISDPDAFCTTVSGIIRTYLEERFGWNAPDRTTEEFLAELHEREDLPDWIRLLLQDFLTRCDLVKFARLEPAESELRALLQSAVQLVNDTVPPPSPAGAPGGQARQPGQPT